ncbi:MAG: hypothetical protein WAV38_34330, partial [Xanthobacteraceae bacterium]
MAEGRGALEYVFLLDAVEEIRARRSVDLDAVRQIFKDAHELGDVDVRLRRPDGSVIDKLLFREIKVDPRGNPADPWEDIFKTGQILAAIRPRALRWSRRRVQLIEERCRIVVTRESLDAFLKAAKKRARTSRAGRPDDHDWIEGKQYLMKELESRGSPRDPKNHVKGWRSDSDAAKLMCDHLEDLDGKAPDRSTARKKA